MKLLCVLFLGLLATAYGGKLYQVEGVSGEGVTLRQNQNDDALKLSLRYMHGDDCKAKLGNMLVSPFTFYRGSNQLFFRDMNAQKVIENSAFYDPDATPWIQGDMHVLNAGRFDNDQGDVVYDVNDFDESFVANYLYDVYRLASSIVLVARNNSMQDDEAAECVETFAGAYRDQLKKIDRGDSKPFSIDCRRARGLLSSLLVDKHGGKLDSTNNQLKLRKKMLDKWTYVDEDGNRKFDFNGAKAADLEVVSDETREKLSKAFVDYYTKTVTSGLRGDDKYFRIEDIARRLNAGTGSLGTPRYYILISGFKGKNPDDDHILDVKRQGKPAVYEYLSARDQADVDENVDNDAHRAVQAYLSLVSRADDHLGYMIIDGDYYSVRARSPYKAALELTGLTHTHLDDLADQWGVLLANAHARSSKGNAALGVPESFASVVTGVTRGRRSEFVSEVAKVALDYARQVDHDYSLFLDSDAQGKLCT